MRRRGFTLIELLVVVTIALIVFVLAGGVVYQMGKPSLNAGAQLLQAALVGARDEAIKTGQPAGIRLLPDPAFPLVYLPNGQLDPSQPLAANRIIPIAAAPNYTEGALTWVNPANIPANFLPAPVLMVEECAAYLGEGGAPTMNAPTSWFWNIRVGDKLQINGSGLWYTVAGPLVLGPAQGNTEMFANVGPVGTQSPWPAIQAGIAVSPEFLFLVNGRDDNQNGWIDEGDDGVDNNANGLVDELAEWELEAWPSAIASLAPQNQPYAIQRRPVATSNSREIALPTNVVIDLTTWGNPAQERSRVPVNPYSGFADIVVSPAGSVSFPTSYSTLSSIGFNSGEYFFWLAERSDVYAPGATVPSLPIGIVLPETNAIAYSGQQIKGNYSLMSITAKTGQISTVESPYFDNPANPIGLIKSGFYGVQLTFNGPVIPVNVTTYQAGIPFGRGLR